MNKRHYNIPIFIPHLGCPFNCIFCDQNRIATNKQAPSPDEVRTIVSDYLITIPDDKKADIEVAFFGGTFTALPRQMQEDYLVALQPFLYSQQVHSVRLSTRPDAIDNDILNLLWDKGVRTIELGVQSLDEQVLKASYRGYTPEDVFKACELIKEYGFKLGIQLMIGLPLDNYHKDMLTSRKVAAIKPSMIRIYPTLVIQGTALDILYRNGKYEPLALNDAVEISKDMFILFQSHGIPVIRMGLQASEELRSDGTITAGPFHPAFGELVEQAVFREQARMLIKDYLKNNQESSLKIMVNPRDISKMTGNRRANILILQEIFNLKELKVAGSNEIKENELALMGLSAQSPMQRLNRNEFINLM